MSDFDLFKGGLPLIFDPKTQLKSASKKLVLMLILCNVFFVANAQELIGAELFSQKLSKTQFKITLNLISTCKSEGLPKQQTVVLFEQGLHKIPEVIQLNKDSVYSNEYAPVSCMQGIENCSQTQRYTTIFTAEESRANYDLVWAYQGLPAGLGNLLQATENTISLKATMTVDGGFTPSLGYSLSKLPFIQVCENQKTTFPLFTMGGDSGTELSIENIALSSAVALENFGLKYPDEYTNSYKNLEGNLSYVGPILPDYGPYKVFSYIKPKAGSTISFDHLVKYNSVKREVELIKIPKGKFIQGLQISTLKNGETIHSYQAFFIFRIL